MEMTESMGAEAVKAFKKWTENKLYKFNTKSKERGSHLGTEKGRGGGV